MVQGEGGTFESIGLGASFHVRAGLDDPARGWGSGLGYISLEIGTHVTYDIATAHYVIQGDPGA
jgi:hypothetical protein